LVENMGLPRGKIPRIHLQRLIMPYLGAEDESIVVGPKVGFDACVLKVGDRHIVGATDPTCGVPLSHHGYFAFHYAASDVSVFGARPRWLIHTLLYPEGTSTETVESITKQLHEECVKWGVGILGGHSGAYENIRRVTSVSTVIGEVLGNELVLPSGAEAGDTILLTKGLGLETAVVAASVRPEISSHVGEDAASRISARLKELTCVEEALALSAEGLVHAMHDVAEGGLSTCLHELGDSSDLGFVVEEEAVLFPDDAQAMLRALKFDPYSCSSTSSLSAAVPQESVRRALEVLEGFGLEARVIGHFLEGEQRIIRFPGRAPPPPHVSTGSLLHTYKG
jgi:hydrogenase expression/formation protein HypE